MDVVLWIATGAAAFFGFVLVHEVGHAVVARLIGVPADEVAVRLTQWPAHVALRGEHGWCEPGSIEYERAYARHDPQLRWLGGFIAAGFVLQSAVMAAVVGIAVLVGESDLGVRLVRVSIVVNGLYLVGDLVASALARAPAGDMSSLLRHSPSVGITTLSFLVGSHGAVFALSS